MNFEWDRQKNEVNIDEHGFDFGDAYRVFDLPMIVDLDKRDDYGENRWVGTGMLDGPLLALSFLAIALCSNLTVVLKDS